MSTSLVNYGDCSRWGFNRVRYDLFVFVCWTFERIAISKNFFLEASFAECRLEWNGKRKLMLFSLCLSAREKQETICISAFQFNQEQRQGKSCDLWPLGCESIEVLSDAADWKRRDSKWRQKRFHSSIHWVSRSISIPKWITALVEHSPRFLAILSRFLLILKSFAAQSTTQINQRQLKASGATAEAEIESTSTDGIDPID